MMRNSEAELMQEVKDDRKICPIVAFVLTYAISDKRKAEIRGSCTTDKMGCHGCRIESIWLLAER